MLSRATSVISVAEARTGRRASPLLFKPREKHLGGRGPECDEPLTSAHSRRSRGRQANYAGRGPAPVPGAPCSRESMEGEIQDRQRRRDDGERASAWKENSATTRPRPRDGRSARGARRMMKARTRSTLPPPRPSALFGSVSCNRRKEMSGNDKYAQPEEAAKGEVYT